MESIWQDNLNIPSFQSLEGDVNTDVLVIGGGLAGILTAYFLKQNNVNYILVERDRICLKTTKNTTAKITYQHGLIYQRILKDYGVEFAQMYLKGNQIAFANYSQLCKNIDCDFQIKDNYVYSISNRKKLENEIMSLEKSALMLI